MTTDLYQFLTGSNKIKIAKAIQNGDLKSIKEFVRREKSRLSFSDLLKRPVFDTNEEIPKDIHNDIEVSKWMVSRILVDETTTFYDICIKNYIKNRNEGNNEKAEDHKKVFEFLLEQKQPKKNFAKLVVKLADYARYNPDFACELLDVMEKHEYKDKQGEDHRIKDKINLSQDVFVSKKILKSLKRSDANNNDVSKPSVSSSNSQKLGLLSLFERFGVLYNQQPAQPNGVTMPLEEFLNLEKTSGKVDNVNLTQPIKCPQR